MKNNKLRKTTISNLVYIIRVMKLQMTKKILAALIRYLSYQIVFLIITIINNITIVILVFFFNTCLRFRSKEPRSKSIFN